VFPILTPELDQVSDSGWILGTNGLPGRHDAPRPGLLEETCSLVKICKEQWHFYPNFQNGLV
jgi:hypothetical protein